jgi:hypothetical protein
LLLFVGVEVPMEISQSSNKVISQVAKRIANIPLTQTKERMFI